jgi:transcriptional regulator with XRE-family HTH domain
VKNSARKSPPKAKLGAVLKQPLAARVRLDYGLTRKQFARMTGFSERALSGWERGGPMSEPAVRKMREVDRLRKALAAVMRPQYIAEWLQDPNDEFQGERPIEVIERGGTDRIYRFIYYLEYGMPV